MSTYSEHVKNARREIDGVHEWQSREGETDATLLASAGIAQAEATLALAKQQQLANLIALATANDDEMIDLLQAEARSVLVRWVPTGADDEHQEIRPDIAGALGIKTGDNE